MATIDANGNTAGWNRAIILCLAGVAAGVVLGVVTNTINGAGQPGLFVFVGVPLRVNLPRFAWVGGTIWGAYAGTVIALIAGSIHLHVRWRKVNAPRNAFAVLPATPATAVTPLASLDAPHVP